MLKPVLDTQRLGSVVGAVQQMEFLQEGVDDEVGQPLDDVGVNRNAETEAVLGDELDARGRGVGQMRGREAGDDRFVQVFGGDGKLGEIFSEIVYKDVNWLLRWSGAPDRKGEEGGIQGDGA